MRNGQHGDGCKNIMCLGAPIRMRRIIVEKAGHLDPARNRFNALPRVETDESVRMKYTCSYPHDESWGCFSEFLIMEERMQWL